MFVRRQHAAATSASSPSAAALLCAVYDDTRHAEYGGEKPCRLCTRRRSAALKTVYGAGAAVPLGIKWSRDSQVYDSEVLEKWWTAAAGEGWGEQEGA